MAQESKEDDDVMSPEYLERQDMIMEELRKKGAELAKLNNPAPKKSNLIKYDPEISEAAKLLEPSLRELHSYSLNSTNPYSDTLTSHISRMITTSVDLQSSVIGKQKTQKNTILGFWNDIDAAIPLVLKVMNMPAEDATKSKISGKENKMLHYFIALIKAHDAIAQHMADKGHNEFIPKYTKEIRKLQGKGALITIISLFTAFACLLGNWIKEIQSPNDYPLEAKHSDIKTEYINPKEPNEFRIANSSEWPLDSENFYKLSEDVNPPEFNARFIESEIEVVLKGNEFTITPEGGKPQTLVLDDKTETYISEKTLTFKGKTYSLPFKLKFTPHPENPDFLTISGQYSDGKAFTSRDIANLQYLKLQSLDTTKPQFVFNEYSDGGNSEGIAILNFCLTVFVAIIGAGLTETLGKRVHMATVKPSEKIDSFVDKLALEMASNGHRVR